MRMDGLEQVVVMATDPESTVRFYVQTLGLLVSNFTDDGTALHCGSQKVVVRRAETVGPTSEEACQTGVTLSFYTALPMPIVTGHLAVRGVPLVREPRRLGDGRAVVTIRDPDGRLVEIRCPADEA